MCSVNNKQGIRPLFAPLARELADQQARLKALYTSHPQMADATL